ncbi:efflux RND transporter permease subunit [Gilvimarinus chinensis]|uniref:efflux RND transporter permease subunit n=1 Tax=Gilvimarinus chinensis TaxID=396005 RepID=UPI0003716D41|nr:MMPL family transporter [Gilvimarinus chinensis]
MDHKISAAVRHHKLILLIFAALTLLLAWQASKFTIDASADTLLTKDNELYLKTRVTDSRFAPQEFLLVAYEPKDHEVLSETSFNDIAALSQAFEKIERVESVRSILNVPLISLADGGLGAGAADQWTIENKNFSPSRLKDTFKNHPIFEDLVINQEQTATAIQLLFKADPELADIESQITQLQEKMLQGELSDEETQQLEALQKQAEPIEKRLTQIRNREIDRIREIIKPYEKSVNLYIGGAHALGYQLINIVKNDLVIFGSAIAVIICLLLLTLFRRLRWVALTATCCVSSVVMTLGLFGALGFKATVISANFVALQLILTLAIVVHLIVQYRESCEKHREWTQKQLLSETLRKKFKPCLYAGITTSVGFASLLLTDIQPVIAFGWMMMIAMLVSITTSLLLFPALLSFLKREEKATPHNLAKHLLNGFYGIADKNGKLVVLLSLVLLGVSAAGLFRLSIENSFINYFKDSTNVYRELSFIDQQFGGTTALDITFSPTKPSNTDLDFTAEQLQRLQLIQAALTDYEASGDTLSVVNFTELAKQINGGKPLTEYEINAVYWTLDKKLRDSLLGSYYNETQHQFRVSTRVQDTTEGLNRSDYLEQIKADMQALEIPEDQYQMTGLFMLYQNILQKLFRSQILSLGLVYVVLTLAFWVIFRSLRLALIGIAPNILTTVTVLGTMGWLGIPLDLMTMTIASIAMGIAVDDTIHYMHRYREESSHSDAMYRTHHSVGYALLYTTLIIVIGFSMLLFSDFVPSIQFGLLSGLAMSIALLADLTLLPVLLKKFLPSKAEIVKNESGFAY